MTSTTLDLLIVMDPYGGMLPDKDTSFALMRGAAARGHRCYHALPSELFTKPGLSGAFCRRIEVDDRAPHVRVFDEGPRAAAEFQVILIRKDPPFDSAYLHMTQLLEVMGDEALIINRPRALRDANEKLLALKFPDLIPRTMVSSSTRDLLAFAAEVGGEAVVKPLDGAGGSGVVGISASDRRARGIVDLLTRDGKQLAIVQEYEPSVVNGDKRVLLLDGKSLGAIRRVPRSDDIRANIHVGGSVEATTLTPREAEIVSRVGPELSRRGLYFVGLDLIGEKLIEINVTSPTGIQELGRLTGTQPELDVIQWIETQVAARQH